MGLGRMHRRLLKRLGCFDPRANGCPSCEAYYLESSSRVARQVSALLEASGVAVGNGKFSVDGLRGSSQSRGEASGGEAFAMMESAVLWQQSRAEPVPCWNSGSQPPLNFTLSFSKHPLFQTSAGSLDHPSTFPHRPLSQTSKRELVGAFARSHPASEPRSFSTTTRASLGGCHLAQPSSSATPPFTPPFHRSIYNAEDARNEHWNGTAGARGDAQFVTRQISTHVGTSQKGSLGSWFSSLWGAAPERPAVALKDTPGVRPTEKSRAPAVRVSLEAPAVSDATEQFTRGAGAAESVETEPQSRSVSKARKIEIWWDRRTKARMPMLKRRQPPSPETPHLGNASSIEGASETGRKGWRGQNGRGKRMEGHVLGKHEHGLRENQVPETAWFVLRKLRSAGYDGYLAGGVVRDLLLGRTPKDVDIVTSATPYQVKRAVPRTMVIGKRFQIARVTVNGTEIEVSSFGTIPRPLKTVGASPGARADVSRAKLLDALRSEIPEGVRHLAASALKRDVTINSLLYDPFKLVLYDFCGGMDDLARKQIRTIIDPEESFAEDPARILRAIRIAARTGFSLTPEVARAATKAGDTALPVLDRSRLQMELAVMMGYGAAERSVRLLWRTGLLKYLLPLQAEYLAAQNFPRSGDRGDLLLDLLRRLDGFTTAAAPCHSALWVVLLALHHAAYQLNPGPLCILTLVKAMTKDSVENGLRHGFGDAQTHLLLTADAGLAAARHELGENVVSADGTVVTPNRAERKLLRRLLRRMSAGSEANGLNPCRTEPGGAAGNGTGSGGESGSGTERNGVSVSRTEPDGATGSGMGLGETTTCDAESGPSGTESDGGAGTGTDGDGTEGLPPWAEEYVAQVLARQKLYDDRVKPGTERLAERVAAIVHQMALPGGSTGGAITRADAARASALFALVANRTSPEVGAYCALVRQSRRTGRATQGPAPKRAVKVAEADLKAGRIEDLADALCVIVGQAVAPVPRRDSVEEGSEEDD